MSENEIERCLAGEWHRDGRGLWAMRQCVWSRDVRHPRHEFGAWQYYVQPPGVDGGHNTPSTAAAPGKSKTNKIERPAPAKDGQ
jgi:hypothetical protein